ncbi:hypothetical protein [Streptomyces sp. NBC_01530]|uniref:hypothetical protein n=1 Tax=Streptomyces sp. NBC_01530 TaxID=2903895 RepID=UPI00386D8A27
MSTPTRPTAPLPQPAADALFRLERAFLPMPLEIVRAVSRYETAALRYDELAVREVLTAAEFDSVRDAQDTMADMFGVLAKAGRTDLLRPLAAATRYRNASAHCRRLAADGDYDGCWPLQDEMAMCRCQLQQAGRLGLIGGAA